MADQRPLSKKLAGQVGKRTAIKRDETGKRIGGGTLITEGLVSRIQVDEGIILEVQNDNSEAIANAISEALVNALEECGINGERFAKDNLTKNRSVDTGRLRNSVTHQIREQERAVYVGTNVEYGPYVEFGTEKANAKPFLRPILTDHGDQFRATFAKYLKDA